jgi:hypothetical protein
MPVCPRDKSDSNPLPYPELNPLVNPLLAAHMGRWAEVYFTNPPEKRDQAVAELLQELENLSAAEPATAQGILDPSGEENTETADAPNRAPSSFEPGRTCAACAYSNSAERTFCGMCGALLPVSPDTRVPQVAEAALVGGDRRHERSLKGNAVEDVRDSAVHSAAVAERSADLELGSLLPERGIPRPEPGPEPLSNRYRVSIGAVLALLLVLLGYSAWRGPQARSDRAATPLVPAVPYTKPAPVNSAPPPSATPAATQSATPSTVPTTAPLPLRVQDKNQVDASSRGDQAAQVRSAPPTLPVEESSSAIVQGGADELAMAENYLNGAPGTTRNSAEAAQWLWKAVSKRNLEATLVLSDLYLRGDGVPKSCDQARLLLDAAAKKGAKAAAERLRELPAFGCE